MNRTHYGFLYITTCLIDGKTYAGKRTIQGTKTDDYYLGSGTYLLNAIKKHGRENFVREIISYHEDKLDLHKNELLLIENSNCLWPNGYNLIKDSVACGDLLENHPRKEEIVKNRNKSISKALKGVPHSAERNSKKSENTKKQARFICEFCEKSLLISTKKHHPKVCLKNPNREPYTFSDESKKKMSDKGKERKHPEKTIEKMRLAQQNRRKVECVHLYFTLSS